MPRLADPKLAQALGDRLSSLRQARGLTQEQLAELTDLEPLTLSRCENGSRSLSLANLARVAEALDMDLAELVDIGRPVKQAPDKDELEWVRLWRQMSASDRDRALRMMREFSR